MFEESVDGEAPEKLAASNPLNLLFEKALRQDAEAMRHLLTLLQTEYYQRIIGNLRSFGTGAQTKTLEDIFQDSILELIKRLEAGRLNDLDEERRKGVLKYFQGLCYGRLRDVVRPRKDPSLQRHKAPLHEEIPDRAATIPGEQHHTDHIALLDDAMTRLKPEHAKILTMYRDGLPYEEMARVTGKKEETLRNLVARLKTVLVMDILPRSDTARINFERKEQEPIRVLPDWEEILAAIARLPAEAQAAVRFVHLEKHTVDELARTLGEKGRVKARARLGKAYESLSARLSFPFPDAFREVNPNKKRPSRKQIEAAVVKLPPMYRDAFLFVYRDGHSVGALGEKAEVGEPLVAQHRLAEACRLLSVKFQEPFPSAYQSAL